MPKFDGKYEDWPGFSDAFKAAVHNNTRLSNVDKLIYLKSPTSKVEALEITDANNPVAWNVLEKLFDDMNLLIMKHIKAFFELSPCVKPSATSIGEILDNVRKHYRALEALKRQFLHFFPICATVSKLDNET